MSEFLLKLIPDWLLPFVFCGLLWFALHYFVVAEFMAVQMARADCSPEMKPYCACAAAEIHKEDKVAVALWTASFGFYKLDSNDTLGSAREEYTSGSTNVCS